MESVWLVHHDTFENENWFFASETEAKAHIETIGARVDDVDMSYYSIKRIPLGVQIDIESFTPVD